MPVSVSNQLIQVPDFRNHLLHLEVLEQSWRSRFCSRLTTIRMSCGRSSAICPLETPGKDPWGYRSSRYSCEGTSHPKNDMACNWPHRTDCPACPGTNPSYRRRSEERRVGKECRSWW